MSRDMQNDSFCNSDDCIALWQTAAEVHATHPFDSWQCRILGQYKLQCNKVHGDQINVLCEQYAKGQSQDDS